MQEQYNGQSMLILTGMPRSGTSFTASLLQEAGLNIGQKLMPPGHGNVKGFFEDLDFVHFHETVLRSQGIHHVGWTLQQDITVDEPFVQMAKETVERNASPQLWGWKDPRTTLFLDFWANLLPQANFLFIFRAPWEVVDSIYRRGDELFVENPAFALQIWMHYNQKLLTFYNQFPHRCLLVNVASISKQAPEFVGAINTKFNTQLVIPPSHIFEQSLLQTKVSTTYRPALINHYYPQALQIYQELIAREVQLSENSDQSWQHKLDTIPSGAWAFQDWIRLRRLERKVKTLQSELDQAKSQLQQTQARLHGSLSDINAEAAEE